MLIGLGGLGSWVAEGLSRGGTGILDGLDNDHVDYSNVSRQNFIAQDIGKNKAVAFGKGHARRGFFGTTFHAWPYRLEEMQRTDFDFSKYDALAVLVDNNPARRLGTQVGLDLGVPVVHAGLSKEANYCYVAVQQPGEACWGCMFPNDIDDNTYPCAPGVIDICFVAAGLILFALDSVICGRHREWNLRAISIDGSLPDTSVTVPKKPNCRLCGQEKEQEQCV